MYPRPRLALCSALLCSLVCAAVVPARGQDPVPDTPPPATPPQAPPPAEEPPLPEAEAAEEEPAADEEAAATAQEDAGNGGQRDRSLPRLDVYFPEAELDFRLSRLVNKVFFEGQVKYNFVDGDITAFLRYRYYGARRTTQFTVFDSVEFEDFEEFSSDFSRVRGGLFLFQWPYNYHQRAFLLTELDRLSSNDEGLRFENNTTNTFVRVGYQLGTPLDDRSNALVGESRARSEPLFTAFREIGPGDAGVTAALTYAFDVGLGDYEYVKAELEALKRFDVTPQTFLVGRLHAGSFLVTKPSNRDEADIVSEVDRHAVPIGEFFRLHGRENLKGLDERLRGTEEAHSTWEYFFPWFLDARRRAIGLEWRTWYWILYGGVGTVGFDRSIYTDFDEYIYDVGVGFESSFRFKKYVFFLSGIVAQALNAEGGVETRISVKSYR